MEMKKNRVQKSYSKKNLLWKKIKKIYCENF
jgi:hypothetical protein